MVEQQIEVKNLKEVQASLRKLDPALKKSLNAKIKDISGVVAGKAKALTPTGPAGGGHVASSVRPFVKSGATGIRFGSAKFPYAGWLEYGGKVGKHKSVSRPFVKTGRYLGRAYVEEKPEILAEMNEAMDQAINEAGLNNG